MLFFIGLLNDTCSKEMGPPRLPQSLDSTSVIPILFTAIDIGLFRQIKTFKI